ncbi:MAG: chemotaxis protein CheW, partial [Acetobacteraceae bacterium]
MTGASSLRDLDVLTLGIGGEIFAVEAAAVREILDL